MSADTDTGILEFEGAEKSRFTGFEKLGKASPSFVERIYEIIDHIHLFSGFTQADVASLAQHMECFHAPAGREIIREGELGDFMLLLLDGSIEINKIDKTGLPQRISLAGPGKTLGEMSLIDGEPRFASCVTLEPTTFAVLDRAALGQILAIEPHLGIKILMQMLVLLNQRLRDAGKRLVQALEID